MFVRRWWRLAWVLCLSAACGPVVSYTRSGPRVRSRANLCPFELVWDAGDRPYVKLGVAEVEAFSPKQLPTTLAKLRPLIAEQVCLAGANGAIPARDGLGRIVLVRMVHFGSSAELLPPPKPPAKAKKKKGKG